MEQRDCMDGASLFLSSLSLSFSVSLWLEPAAIRNQGDPGYGRTQSGNVVFGGFVARRAVELQRAARRNAGAAGFAFAATFQTRLQSFQPAAGCSDRPP